MPNYLNKLLTMALLTLVQITCNKPDKCPPGNIYLTGFLEGCFPLAYLGESCQSHKQCYVPNSFCGFTTDWDAGRVCKCNRAHGPNTNGSRCEPFHRCSNMGSNDEMLPSQDCDNSQFCKEGACHCLPQHNFNYQKECAPWNSNARAIEDLNARLVTQGVLIETLKEQNQAMKSSIQVIRKENQIQKEQIAAQQKSLQEFEQFVTTQRIIINAKHEAEIASLKQALLICVIIGVVFYIGLLVYTFVIHFYSLENVSRKIVNKSFKDKYMSLMEYSVRE